MPTQAEVEKALATLHAFEEAVEAEAAVHVTMPAAEAAVVTAAALAPAHAAPVGAGGITPALIAKRISTFSEFANAYLSYVALNASQHESDADVRAFDKAQLDNLQRALSI